MEQKTPTQHRGILPYKAKGKDHRGDYRLRLELSLLFSVSLLLLLFRLPLYPSAQGFEVAMAEQEVVQMEEILQTNQEALPPPPPRPPLPIEVPNDVVLEDDFLDLDAALDFDEPIAALPPPPAPADAKEEVPEAEPQIFVVVEEMPEIVGGMQAVYAHLDYPEIARKAGLEGLVVVQLVIEPDGTGTGAVIAKSAGAALDEAALAAVQHLQFQPGRQRGKAVRVKFSLPIRFRLRAPTTSAF